MSGRASRIASRIAGAAALVLVAGAASVMSGCIVEEHHHPAPVDTAIQFDEVTNLGYACGDSAAFSWTVTNRDTGDTGTAGCQQPVYFPSVAPGAAYTFDVVGYSGSTLCWQGSCSVAAAPGVVTHADCSSQIVHLCGL